MQKGSWVARPSTFFLTAKPFSDLIGHLCCPAQPLPLSTTCPSPFIVPATPAFLGMLVTHQEGNVPYNHPPYLLSVLSTILFLPFFTFSNQSKSGKVVGPECVHCSIINLRACCIRNRKEIEYPVKCCSTFFVINFFQKYMVTLHEPLKMSMYH